MVEFWVNAIIDGKRAFHQTPAKLKEQVRARLVELGREDLIDED
mgnify:CR=1 FL=1